MSQSALPMLGARRDQMFPTMTQADIDRLRRFGESKFYETGDRIVRAGHVAPGLIVILSGKVEVTQGCGPEQRETIVTHLPGQFAGELAQLSARPSLVDADALEPVQALVVRSDRLRDLLVQEAELGERIMRALILRRVGLRACHIRICAMPFSHIRPWRKDSDLFSRMCRRGSRNSGVPWSGILWKEKAHVL